MRSAIEPLFESSRLPHPDHPGLAYDVWGPLHPESSADKEEKKEAADAQAQWIDWVAGAPVPGHYPLAFRRWRASFEQDGSRALDARLDSRLLLGHGNSSPTGVGITLHHTWGVPVIPGSAVKGVVAHYVMARYGAPARGVHPLDATHPDPDRAMWQGVSRRGARIEHGPGVAYRLLFGAPRADSDSAWEDCRDDDLPGPVREWFAADPEAFADAAVRRHALIGARQGMVVFHDALLIPDSIDGARGVEGGARFLVHDVLTVHQKTYYDAGAKMADRGNVPWPNDYDAPNPVSFLTVAPGVRFLFPLSGPPEWTRLGADLLRKALTEWGMGGKTSAGYGRFGRIQETIAPKKAWADPVMPSFLVWLDEEKQRVKRQETIQREVLDAFESEWLDRLVPLDEESRNAVVRAIKKSIRNKRLKIRRDALLARLARAE